MKGRFRMPSPAMAIAILALVMAMGGGAYAAKKYVITSTKQIKPSVLKSLQGKNGKTGKTGATGATGATGPTGAAGTAGTAGGKGETGAQGPIGPAGPKGKEGEEGPQGPIGPDGPAGPAGPAGPTETTLPSGKTETGVWSFTAAGVAGTYMSQSFPLQTTFTPTFHWVAQGSTPECPGTASEPKAESGQLCVYKKYMEGAGTPTEENAEPKSGFVLEFPITEAEGYGYGSWAVTAP